MVKSIVWIIFVLCFFLVNIVSPVSADNWNDLKNLNKINKQISNDLKNDLKSTNDLNKFPSKWTNDFNKINKQISNDLKNELKNDLKSTNDLNKINKQISNNMKNDLKSPKWNKIESPNQIGFPFLNIKWYNVNDDPFRSVTLGPITWNDKFDKTSNKFIPFSKNAFGQNYIYNNKYILTSSPISPLSSSNNLRQPLSNNLRQRI